MATEIMHDTKTSVPQLLNDNPGNSELCVPSFIKTIRHLAARLFFVFENKAITKLRFNHKNLNLKFKK
jgi:hypothetical protein